MLVMYDASQYDHLCIKYLHFLLIIYICHLVLVMFCANQYDYFFGWLCMDATLCYLCTMITNMIVYAYILFSILLLLLIQHLS